MTDPTNTPAEPADPGTPEPADPPAAPAEAHGPAGDADEAERLEIAATVEAILFSSDSPLSPAKIAQLAELPGRREVKQAVALLNERYERMGCSFRIESIAGGYQMLTLPEYHDVVARLFRARSETRLSQAALETLAIVAYRQPVLRADIEAIRGVASGEVLRGLMERQLVRIVGRAEVLGRPMLYGTTRRFLEVFGLADIRDLPKVEQLRGGDREPPERPAPQPACPAPAGSAEEQPDAASPPASQQPDAGPDRTAQEPPAGEP